MSRENVGLVKEGYAAFVRGDIGGVLDFLDPEVETSDPFGFSTSDAYHGHEGFVQTVRDGLDAFERYEIVTDEFIDARDDVIVSVRISGIGRGSGAIVDMRLFHVWTLRDGKAVLGGTFRTKDGSSKPRECSSSASRSIASRRNRLGWAIYLGEEAMAKSKIVLALVLALGALAVPAITSASHVRPQGASPMRVPFVPAYKACAAPNGTHGAPLAFASCAPPVQASNFLTVGTPDTNGAGASSLAFMKLKVKTTSPEDLLISLSVSDVRCKPSTSASVCNSANSADGPDYSGDLQGNATIRISDHYNGPSLTEAATVQDIPFPVNVPCANTADTSTGGTCQITTCSSCIGPPRGDLGGQRTVVGITQFLINDGGGDGQVATASDNTAFMRQGLFIP